MTFVIMPRNPRNHTLFPRHRDAGGRGGHIDARACSVGYTPRGNRFRFPPDSAQHKMSMVYHPEVSLPWPFSNQNGIPHAALQIGAPIFLNDICHPPLLFLLQTMRTLFSSQIYLIFIPMARAQISSRAWVEIRTAASTLSASSVGGNTLSCSRGGIVLAVFGFLSNPRDDSRFSVDIVVIRSNPTNAQTGGNLDLFLCDAEGISKIAFPFCFSNSLTSTRPWDPFIVMKNWLAHIFFPFCDLIVRHIQVYKK